MEGEGGTAVYIQYVWKIACRQEILLQEWRSMPFSDPKNFFFSKNALLQNYKIEFLSGRNVLLNEKKLKICLQL
jgi:hypothetical protein